MLIARVSPILQVTYARDGQLKYSGHTISFPQEISNITSHQPNHVGDLDMLIVNKKSIGQQQYNFYVSRTQVSEVLRFKIQNDLYYKDVEIDEDALEALPITSTNISDLLF